MYTKQETFNIVIAKLSEQGEASIGTNSCAYRDSKGNKCAIGHLIPDELYETGFESHCASTVLSRLAQKGFHIFDKGEEENDFPFAMAMQYNLHDKISDSPTFKEDLQHNAKDFALLYGLEL